MGSACRLRWFVLGFVFNLIALIVIAALTPLDKAKAMEDPADKGRDIDELLEKDELRRKSADLAASLAQSRAKLNN